MKFLLRQRRSNKAEIEELKQRLAGLAYDEGLVGNSVIMDYRKGYPQPQSVVGFDYDLYEKRRARWTKRLEQLQKEVDEVEEWIEAIPDSISRRCLRMYYMDGLTQDQIAKKVHVDQATVSRKIQKFVKDA